MTRKKRKTAAELIAELEMNPAYMERRQRQDEMRRLRAEELARAEAPLVQELRAAGAEVSSVWDLVNTSRPYPKLVPILLDHIDHEYPERIREGVARALAVPEARVGWDKLVNLYLSLSERHAQGLKWPLHLAIAAAADVSVVDTLIRLAVDKRHGENRSFFVDALARINDPRARAALAELSEDPEVADGMRRIRRKRTQK